MAEITRDEILRILQEHCVGAVQSAAFDVFARLVDEWRPIQCAPLDGTHILLAFGQDRVCEGWYDDNGLEPRPWKFVDTGTGENPTAKGFINSSRDGVYGPSQWMPMPVWSRSL